MQPDLEPMLPPEPRTSTAPPLWVWALVVGMGAVAAYSGYTALSANQLYHEGESVRLDLARQRDRLKANVTDLTRQLEQANRSLGEVENALKQSRANTESASAQITDLQKQVGELQQQVTDLQQRSADLEKARNAAEAEAKAAKDAVHGAKDASAKEIASLKSQLAAAQKKLNQALADLKKEREFVSPVPMPPPSGEVPQDAPPPR
ncbi:hypothetical protein [Hyphomicrobium sp. NDB2Meth4]|uniref:hypothetical protein n=1 Tax=Hyphomicrobium sp. NDB2Meth4 TaxID=1892846 RepID=UPI001114D5DC|nr:hypothetical protein [Hyphomicrobium sp. NDB2Meth4]